MVNLDHVNSRFKKGHDSPKLEDMDAGGYAYNYNPNDSLQFFDENSIRRHHTFKEHMMAKFKKYVAPYADYEMHIEISKLSRLHLHGLIIFKSIEHIIRFFLYGHKQMMDSGTTVIKKIDDPAKWADYYTKQHRFWDAINFDPVFRRESASDEHKSDRQILREDIDDALDYGVPIYNPSAVRTISTRRRRK